MRLSAATGIAARSILLLHLRAIGFVMFALLVVAFSIDLSETLDELREFAAESGRNVFSVIVEYLSYRAIDIVTRLLPMACLAGAFFAELFRQQRLEDVILATAGAGPALVLTALLGVGIVGGTLQTALEGWLRPAAVFRQVEMGVGSYAKRFAPGLTGYRWFVSGDRALRARVLVGPEPELRDLMLFEGINKDSLKSVMIAERATPADSPQKWQLEGLTRWSPSERGHLQPTSEAQASLNFPLTRSHVRYLGVGGFYMPFDALKEVVSVKTARGIADAETAYVRRFAAFFLPGIFALLGASLAQTSRTGRTTSGLRLVSLAVLGYVSVVSVKVFWSLGEFGEISAIWANLGSLLFAGGLAAWLQFRRF